MAQGQDSDYEFESDSEKDALAETVECQPQEGLRQESHEID